MTYNNYLKKTANEIDSVSNLDSIKLNTLVNADNFSKLTKSPFNIEGYEVALSGNAALNYFSLSIKKNGYKDDFIHIYFNNPDFSYRYANEAIVNVSITQFLLQHGELLIYNKLSVMNKLQYFMSELLHEPHYNFYAQDVTQIILAQDIRLNSTCEHYLKILSHIYIAFYKINHKPGSDILTFIYTLDDHRSLKTELLTIYNKARMFELAPFDLESNILRFEYKISNATHLRENDNNMFKCTPSFQIGRFSDLFTLDVEDEIRKHFSNRHLFKYKFHEFGELSTDSDFKKCAQMTVPNTDLTYFDLYQELSHKVSTFSGTTSGLVRSY